MAVVSVMGSGDPAQPPRFALFELGFRAFYLAGAGWAVADIALWMARMTGLTDAVLIDAGWHAHEMLFGFIAAIVAGFALTAVRNWTGLATPTGVPLALLLALWGAGRVAQLLPESVPGAVLDLAFLPAIAVAVARPIWRAGQRRNLFLPALLLLLAVLNLGYHASRLGLCAAPLRDSLVPALYVLVLLESIVAGRVIPGFTGNVIGRKLPRGDALDVATIATTAVALALAASRDRGWPPAATAALAAALHAVRLARWQPWAARRQAILWILHLSYAWIPVGLLLLALAAQDVVPASAALHAFGVGATGGLIAAMTTRSARGHTARSLQAGRTEIALYVLIHCAAVARVLAACGVQDGILLPAAALAWSCAFGAFLVRYAPWLVRPRLDGQRG